MNDGISNFEKGLTATTTTIKDGTGNFNTVSGSTQSDIVFTGNGTANLHGNLTGDITGTGIVNTKGSVQTITGNIGNTGNFNIDSGTTTVDGSIGTTTITNINNKKDLD